VARKRSPNGNPKAGTVPGEIVSFATSDDAKRLVGALRDLSAEGATEFVLVGGLAVASRLNTFHRATQDLDALTGDDRQHFSELAIDVIPGAAMRDADLFVDGVRVDIIDIDTHTPYSAIAELDNPLDQLFNATHLFAHTDAGPLTLTSGNIDATVRVASARSLLMTKLHAYLNPRRNRRKHPSDALDVYRLGSQLVADPPRPLADREIPDVVRWIATWGLQRVREQPAEMTRRLALIGTHATAREVDAPMSLVLEDLAA